MNQIRRRSNNNIIAILIVRLEQCSMEGVFDEGFNDAGVWRAGDHQMMMTLF